MNPQLHPPSAKVSPDRRLAGDGGGRMNRSNPLYPVRGSKSTPQSNPAVTTDLGLMLLQFAMIGSYRNSPSAIRCRAWSGFESVARQIVDRRDRRAT